MDRREDGIEMKTKFSSREVKRRDRGWPVLTEIQYRCFPIDQHTGIGKEEKQDSSGANIPTIYANNANSLIKHVILHVITRGDRHPNTNTHRR
jgi:hypothetical protein